MKGGAGGDIEGVVAVEEWLGFGMGEAGYAQDLGGEGVGLDLCRGRCC